MEDPKTYAYIQDGAVHEIIPPAYWDSGPKEGEYIPLSERYTWQFCAQCVDITDMDPMPDQRWLYDWDTGVFTPMP